MTGQWRRWCWPAAMVAAAVPFLRGVSTSRVFFVRDLSLFFWGQHLYLRHAWLSGQFPLWDPYVAAGQPTVANALRQMFLPPAVVLRLIGNDAFAFNLFVAAPFPLAALGAWLFFRRRLSTVASMLGAIAFAVSGPIVSTSNFPNLSWSVAAMPWVLWAADRVAASRDLRSTAILATAVACQALAGEPVTQTATLVLAAAFVVTFAPTGTASLPRAAAAFGVAVALGVAMAAVQLLPLAEAAASSHRLTAVNTAYWSLHPAALLETIAFELFGDYYSAQFLWQRPWMAAVNSGREPFFFSVYFGVPLAALAVYGFVARAVPRWTTFWVAVAAVGLVGAFGTYTPVYPFLQRHLPLLGSFRFPAKYLTVIAMAVAAGAAAGWDALSGVARPFPGRAAGRARMAAVTFAAAVGALTAVAAAACIYAPKPTVFRFYALAQSLGVKDPVAAAEFMLTTLPRQASWVLVLSAAAAFLLLLGDAARRESSAARAALGILIVVDLLARAWPVNPVLDVSWLGQPPWVSYTRADPGARFYIGSKRDGTNFTDDLDSSGPFRNPEGLWGVASRAATSAVVNFEPSAFRARDMLSYDLAALWPPEFTAASKRFFRSGRDERDRFLDRTGVRYRILPKPQAKGRNPVVRIPNMFESYLFDVDGDAAPRVEIVPAARVVSDAGRQVDALFDGGWNARAVVLVDREPQPSGTAGAAAQPSASITLDGADRVIVDASAPADGAYLLVRDTYDTGWRARVDGQPAPIVRADGLFRAVRVAAGRHVVEFVYRPRAFFAGLAVSLAALAAALALFVRKPPKPKTPTKTSATIEIAADA